MIYAAFVYMNNEWPNFVLQFEDVFFLEKALKTIAVAELEWVVIQPSTNRFHLVNRFWLKGVFSDESPEALWMYIRDFKAKKVEDGKSSLGD